MKRPAIVLKSDGRGVTVAGCAFGGLGGEQRPGNSRARCLAFRQRSSLSLSCCLQVASSGGGLQRGHSAGPCRIRSLVQQGGGPESQDLIILTVGAALPNTGRISAADGQGDAVLQAAYLTDAVLKAR